MTEQSLMNEIDASIGDFFAQWDIASTLIVGLLLILLVYPLFINAEPDVHPFLLARQAAASPIRQPGESATYRSTEIPYGYPLRSGLGIKDPGASKWTTGRDGDLRDIWRQAVNGATKEGGANVPSTSKISSIVGTDKVISHDLKEMTEEINAVGRYVQNAGGKKVAVCLSNSVELLQVVFASSFYSFSAILVPYSQDVHVNTDLLSLTEFDTVVAEAGSISIESLLASSNSVRRVIWVVRAGGLDTEWDELPKGASQIDLSTWHGLVSKTSSQSNEVPALDIESTPLPISMIWQRSSGVHELVEYTHANLISAVGALSSSLPRLNKLGPSDSILPTTALTTSYALVWSLLTLFSGSQLLLTTVSGPKVSLIAATKSARQLIKPTHIIADARTIPIFLTNIQTAFTAGGVPAKLSRWQLNRSVVQGILPAKSQTSKPAYLPAAFSQLKTLYIDVPSYLPPTEHPTSSTLATLRLLLHARVVAALTAGIVAGYVAQGNTLDYRDKNDVVGIGAVASSIEVHLAGEETEMSKQDAVGRLVVKGPAVAGPKGEKRVVEDVKARIDVDHSIVLVA